MWVQIPALSLTKCVALSEFLNAFIFSRMGPIINRNNAEKTKGDCIICQLYLNKAGGKLSPFDNSGKKKKKTKGARSLNYIYKEPKIY